MTWTSIFCELLPLMLGPFKSVGAQNKEDGIQQQSSVNLGSVDLQTPWGNNAENEVSPKGSWGV